MNRLFIAALDLQAFCVRKGWRFCVIGGVAVQRWGEPRLTLDVDVTLLSGFGAEESFVDETLAVFEGRLPDAREFALKTRVLLLKAANGVPLDVSLGAMPFEERAIDRASDYAIAPGVTLRTCSAEDLIVHKVFADRDKDWLDVQGILLRQAGRLNEKQVFEELAPLLALKGHPDASERLRALIARSRG